MRALEYHVSSSGFLDMRAEGRGPSCIPPFFVFRVDDEEEGGHGEVLGEVTAIHHEFALSLTFLFASIKGETL